jgi:hypothetical protein
LKLLAALHTQFGPSSTSEKKKKKKMLAHEKNPNFPLKAYGHFIRKAALWYYSKQTLISLK